MTSSRAKAVGNAIVRVGSIEIGAGRPLVLIAGPCVLESERATLTAAERLARLSEAVQIPLIFKASYEKDNRSTPDGYRGPGLTTGLRWLDKVRRVTGLPVLSDVHRPSDVMPAAEVLDIVQVPAFLCRQTSLLLEVGRCGRPVNLKKGQFIAPEDMAGSIQKLRVGGATDILLTERGSCFGYNRLVVDMTSIPILQSFGCPVVFDAGHAVRNYGIASSDPKGGRVRSIPVLARSGVAAGADALFIEAHPRPRRALCDAASMLSLDELATLVLEVLPIASAVRQGASVESARGRTRRARRTR